LSLLLRSKDNPGNEDLNRLFRAAWSNHSPRDFQPVLRQSLTYISAYVDGHLIGFVNVAWDGGKHAFLMDTTVHPDHQRCGIGKQLVREAVSLASELGIEWVHVDYKPPFKRFYESCGFQPTNAGLYHLEKRGVTKKDVQKITA
jgi:GNAT superfamily N-acetyltransferase|tara:strand:- start:250 stop:681 length:432 start_codon:yes stop_codon:yes gene_type:complete